MSTSSFTCPCCGYRTFSEPPGSYEICEVCFWEDDLVQLLDAGFAGGANRPSLADSQVNFQRHGAMEARFKQHVRAPGPDDEREPGWRTVQEKDLQSPLRPMDLADDDWRSDVVYYWRRNAT